MRLTISRKISALVAFGLLAVLVLGTVTLVQISAMRHTQQRQATLHTADAAIRAVALQIVRASRSYSDAMLAVSDTERSNAKTAFDQSQHSTTQAWQTFTGLDLSPQLTAELRRAKTDLDA
jgi:hypothetical protein